MVFATFTKPIAKYLSLTGTKTVRYYSQKIGLLLRIFTSPAQCILAVLSPDYLEAHYTHPEWAAAFAQDPKGEKRTLIPVRIRECDLSGLLNQIITIDLVDLDEASARERLLQHASGKRGKPAIPPTFPGTAERSVLKQPHFPGGFAGNDPDARLGSAQQQRTDMKRLLAWLQENKQWVFSGIGVALLILIIGWILSDSEPGPTTVTVKGGVAAGRDIKNSTININEYFPEQLKKIMRDVIREESTAQAQVATLSTKLDVTDDAIVSFFRILDENKVPLEKLPEKLAEIAQRHREMLDRLAVLDTESPEIKDLLEQARTAVEEADYDLADQLFTKAETAKLAVVQEKLAAAQEEAERGYLEIAEIIAERGELSLTRLNYRVAAQHFEKASERVPATHPEQRNKYLDRYAYALYRQGTEKVDKNALPQAIRAYREILKVRTRAQLPQQWAMTQNNLGSALQEQGIRTGGEEGRRLLAEAVDAYRNALQVRTRAQLPQQWAT
ncbi:MAG: TIR domain-containing protein, partial [bacterium]|nr:TIR domain-containing protein [bacterium]